MATIHVHVDGYQPIKTTARLHPQIENCVMLSIEQGGVDICIGGQREVVRNALLAMLGVVDNAVVDAAEVKRASEVVQP